MELRSRDSSHRHGVHPNAKKEMSVQPSGSIKGGAINRSRRLDNRPFLRKSLAGATRGKSVANSPCRETAENNPDPLPWVATSCRSERIVRRRSPPREMPCCLIRHQIPLEDQAALEAAVGARHRADTHG